MRLVLDADGLIKLNRAGILRQIVEAYSCVVPRAVFDEVVLEGTLRRYEDASVIEAVLVGRVEVLPSDQPGKGDLGLGKGETAILGLIPTVPDSIVVSDDRRFLSILSSEDIPFLTPADVLVMMRRQGTLTEPEARDALDRLRPAIRTKAYWEARETLSPWENRSVKKTKVIPLRIPESLDALAGLSAEQEHTDKATALRQWLHRGAELYVLKLVAEGRISLSYAAELLETSIYDLYNLAETHGIELGASDEQRRKSRELAARLVQSSE